MSEPQPTTALVHCRIDDFARLRSRHPEALDAASALLHAALAPLLIQCRGAVSTLTPEMILTAFADPLDAVSWGLEALRSLSGMAWPDPIPGLELAIGVHCGHPMARPNPLTGLVGYVGAEVHIAEDVCRMVSGGQLVVTQEVLQQLGPAGIAVLGGSTSPLGTHRLGAEGVPTDLHQIDSPHTPKRDFSPLRALRQATNLPERDNTVFIGRQSELLALDALFLEADTRLATILGPGGAGKTRLSRQHARHGGLRPVFEAGGGVWFFDLTEASTMSGVLHVTAEVLGLELSPETSEVVQGTALARAIDAMGDALFVFDNCEQVLDAVRAVLGPILEVAPRARLLCTSRHPIAIDGEHCFELGPMSVTDGTALFVASAQRQRHTFDPDPAARARIEAIVARLEGSPLAIELAAARVGMMSLARIEVGLSKQLDLLSKAGAAASGRHGTLRACIGWTWALLSDAERAALSQLSIFRGGFSIDSADAVVALPDSAPPLREVLRSLKDWSVVAEASEPGPSRRFGLPLSIRAYASDMLAVSDKDGLAVRHAAHCVALVDGLRSHLGDHRASEAITRIGLELENLLAASENTLAIHPTLAAEALLAAGVWFERHMPTPGYTERLAALITLGREGEETPLLGWLLFAGAKSALIRGEYRHPLVAQSEEAVGIARRCGDKALEMQSLLQLSSLVHRERSDAIWPDLDLAESLARELGDTRTLARAVQLRGLILVARGRNAEGKRFIEDAFAMADGMGDMRLTGSAAISLIYIALHLGDPILAQAYIPEALRRLEAAGDHRLITAVHINIGLLRLAQRRALEAERHFRRGITGGQDSGTTAAAIHNLAACALFEGRTQEAVDLFSDSLTRFEAFGHTLFATLARLSLVVCETLQGDPEVAATQLAAVRAGFGPNPERLAVERALCCDGFIVLARALQSPPSERAEALDALRSMFKGPLRESGLTLFNTPFSHHLWSAILRHFPEVEPDPQTMAALRVAEDGAWFIPPGGSKVALGRRAAPRRILMVLVGLRLEGQGGRQTLRELVGVGWPGEKMLDAAGANRVYVAVATLRKLGLHALLKTDDRGYFLDPSTEIWRVPTGA